MNYEQFRFEWYHALDEAGLLQLAFPPTETIELNSMNRLHHMTIVPRNVETAGPFFATAALVWMWDSLQSARSMTTEEDTLAELLGEGGEDEDTEPPWVRVDITLRASLPEDSPLPLPSPGAWCRWAAAVNEELAPLLPIGAFDDAEGLASFCWRDQPTLHAHCGLDGQLHLTSVELSAWQGIGVPRQWDDPERAEDEEEPGEPLADLMDRLSEALSAWQNSLQLLVPA